MSSILNPNQRENEPLLATGPPVIDDEEVQIIGESVHFEEPLSETGLLVTNEEVEQIVAENAYYKAEQRGFKLGFEDHDWMESEKEVLTRIWPVFRNRGELIQKGIPATAR